MAIQKRQVELFKDDRFSTILSDPPWEYEDQGTRMSPSYDGEQRAKSHYQTMPLEAIAAINVARWALPDALLFLWAPNAFVLDGSATYVCRAWGFEPKQIIPWVKTDGAGKPRAVGGHYTGVCTEPLIVAARGAAASLVTRKMVPGVIIAQLGRHSAKPDASYALIESITEGPCLELFARRKYSERWTVMGDQLTGETLGGINRVQSTFNLTDTR